MTDKDKSTEPETTFYQEVPPCIVDKTRSERNVWLLKIHKDLHKAWVNEKRANQDLGKVRIYKDRIGNIKKITMSVLAEGDFKKEYLLKNIPPASDSRLLTFSEIGDSDISMEGSVDSYLAQPMNLNLNKTESNMKIPEKHEIQELTIDELNENTLHKHRHSPQIVLVGPSNVKKQNNNYVKEDDADIVKEKLFQLFQEHEFWLTKDLQLRTKQPESYLKEILKSICKQHNNGPHKNHWQLQKEFL